MKNNLSIRYIYLTVVFISLSTTSAFAFQASDVGLFKNFLTSNDIRTCTLSDADHLKVLNNSELSSYTNCLVVDSGQMNLKPGSTCSLARVVNGIIPNMNSLCQAAARQAALDQKKASGGGGSTASGASGAAGSSTANQIIAPVVMAGAMLLQNKNQKKYDAAEKANDSSAKKSSASDLKTDSKGATTAKEQTVGTGNEKTNEITIKEADGETSTFKYDSEKNAYMDKNGVEIDPIKYMEYAANKSCPEGKCTINLPQELQGPAKEALKTGPPTLDEQAEQAQKLGAELASSAGAAASAGASKVAASGCPQSATLTAEAEAYKQAFAKCSSSAAKAANFCSMIRSDKAKAVQLLMTAGAAVVEKMSSASQTCSATANLSKVGQIGMTIAQVTCSGMKMMCDTSCATAATKYQQLSAAAKQAISCGSIKIASGQAAFIGGGVEIAQGQQAQAGSVEVEKGIAITQKDLAAHKAQCDAHALDIMQMGIQVAGLATAFMQAKDCEKKLTANNGSGDGTSASVTDVCKEPANASMQMCKCSANPMAEGCPAAITAKTGNSDTDKGMTLKPNGIGSQMAAPGGYSQKALSPSARTALGLDSGNNDGAWGSSPNAGAGSGSAFGNAAAAGGAAGGGTASSAGLEAKEKLATADKDKKAVGGGLFGGLGGFGGLFGGGDKNKDGRTFKGGNPVDNAKRKLANEEYAAEVSAASGKSNWEKVRSRYVENRGTLLGN